MIPSTSTDDTIPILTEIITSETIPNFTPRSNDSRPANSFFHSAADEKNTAPATATPAAPANLSTTITAEADWLLIEKTLQENILNQLLLRIDTILEHRIRDSLADAIQAATDHMTTEIRQGLSNTLSDVINRAIKQEINTLHPKK